MMLSKGTIVLSSLLRKPLVLQGLRLAIGLVFVIASLDKLDHPGDFYQMIMGYQIVPWAIAIIIAMWLPWIELCVGALLLVGVWQPARVWQRASALLLAGVSVIFIGGIASALARGIELQCGCFGASPENEIRTWPTLWQEVALLIGCLWLWWGLWPRPDPS